MKKWMRKRLATYIITVLVIPIAQAMGLADEMIQHIVTLAMTYIGGQSVSDFAMALKGSKTE